jgi:hypothetical protein
MHVVWTQGFKANVPTPCGLPARGPRPGLELANDFSIVFVRRTLSFRGTIIYERGTKKWIAPNCQDKRCAFAKKMANFAHVKIVGHS